MSNPLAALQHIAYTTNTPEEKKCLKLNLLIGHLAISISWSSLCVHVQKASLENAIDFCRLAFVQVAHSNRCHSFRFHGSRKIQLINHF